MRYPVRCYCEPTKLYGYLDLPGGLRSGHMTSVMERVSIKMPAFRDMARDGSPATVDNARRHPIKLMRVVDHAQGLDEVAVYSDDRPIEFWRKIVGFSELKPQPFTFRTVDAEVIAECEVALGTHGDVGVMVETPTADRRVVGRVKAVKHDQHNAWSDITIEELVPATGFEPAANAV